MMNRFRTLFWPALMVLTPALSILIPSTKEPLLAGMELVAQVFVIAMFSYLIWDSRRRQQEIPHFQFYFLLAMITATVADIGYNTRVLLPGHYPPAYNLVVELLYPLFALLLCIAVSRGIRLNEMPIRKWLRVGLPAFLIYEFIAFKFLTIPTYYLDHTLSFKFTASLYNLMMGFLFAVAIAFSLRTVARRPFYFFQLLLLLPVADLAIRFQSSFVSWGSFSWAELGWCTVFIGYAWLFSKPETVRELFSEPLQLAPLMSFRTLLSLSVCGANILFLIGILLFKVYSMETAVDASSALLLLYLFWLGANELSIRLADDLDRATMKLFRSNKHVSTDGFINLTIEEVESKARIHELNQILDSYNDLVQQTNKMIQAQAVANRNATIAEIASQVAHDVRSPLSALNMVLSTLDPLPENKRMVIRNATQRITDIANSLALRGQNIYDDSPTVPADVGQMVTQKTMIVSTIDALASEKRLQFRDRANLRIETFLSLGYGCFSEINRSEFCRVLSNLINNSVEALVPGRPGQVNLTISSDLDSVFVIIKDNGKGIPPDLLHRIGERGFSYGKTHGSGLGICHAHAVIQKFKGELKIESRDGQGTQLTLRLPRCQPPNWFVETLDVSRNSIVVSIDDDMNIHEVWRQKLPASKLLTFSSLHEFISWLHAPGDKSSALYLMDYEFHGDTRNGIDVVDQFGLQSNTILVSSRFEEPGIRQQVEKLGLRMIPKSLATMVPVISKKPSRFESELSLTN